MHIGLISGSARPTGSTHGFLRKLEQLWTEQAAFAKTVVAPGTVDLTFAAAPDLDQLPLFSPERLAAGAPAPVREWATFVKTADLLVVATPEYAHGIPAALKSALEWLVASGEFSRKRSLAIVVAPHAPRGEHCIQALVWTLRAMDAAVVAEAPIHATGAQLDGAPGNQEWAEITRAMYDLAVNPEVK